MAERRAAAEGAVAEDPWRWWRSQMPVTERWAYFDHAAVAPLPRPAAERIGRFAAQAAAEGDTCWPEWAADVEQLRRGTARWLGAGADEVLMIPNTTFGINIVAEGYPWKAGDNAVILAGEFPSNRLPWVHQQDRGVEVREVVTPGGRVELSALDEAIDQRTRVVSLSWVDYASGFRVDLDAVAELAHRRGALLMVDAIQGLGPFSVDLSRTPIDFLAADGHKWLLGPEGAGIAFLRKEHLDRLRCTSVGWNSVRGRFDFGSKDATLRDEAARYEGGSANMVGLMALHQSLQMFWRVRQECGETALADRLIERSRRLGEALRAAGATLLTDWPDAHRSGILMFEKPGVAPAAVRDRCREAGVVLSCRGAGVRASVHVYNDDEDIARLADAVAAA